MSWWLTVTLLGQILFSFPGLANLVYFFKGDCLQVLGFRNNLPHVFTGGKNYTHRSHWWNKLYVCVYPGCITLLPKIVTREELQEPAYNFVRISGKRGCPLIRACSVITSNTVPQRCRFISKGISAEIPMERFLGELELKKGSRIKWIIIGIESQWIGID